MLQPLEHLWNIRLQASKVGYYRSVSLHSPHPHRLYLGNGTRPWTDKQPAPAYRHDTEPQKESCNG